jgi:uncharacterized protein (DUF1330 family)
MPVYFVVNATITDPEGFAGYREASRLVPRDPAARTVVSTLEAETVEGAPAGPRLLVMEFPNRAAFDEWYHSSAYRDIIGRRLASTEGFAVLADTGA